MSRRKPKKHALVATVFAPCRVTLSPFDVSVPAVGPSHDAIHFALAYEDILRVQGIHFVSKSWTRMQFTFGFLHNGTPDEFRVWAKTSNGARRIVDQVVKLQNQLIDHIKTDSPYNPNLRGLRHFGPADWPYLGVAYEGVNILERISTSIHAEVATVPVSFNSGALVRGKEVPPVTRVLLRAHDLCDCGYPMEALLVAFAVLDATVQDTLRASMQSLGITGESAEALLRNTTQSRLATYLDPVLKLALDRSLKSDDGALFEDMLKLNRQRNDAIHGGKEVTRSDAQKACQVVFDVLDYLNSVAPGSISLPPRPVFPDA